jgi:hypothetical protein
MWKSSNRGTEEQRNRAGSSSQFHLFLEGFGFHLSRKALLLLILRRSRFDLRG